MADARAGGLSMGRDAASVAAYSAPIVLFGILTMAEGYLAPAAYPVAYVVKAVAVTAALAWFRAPRAEVHPARTVVPIAAAAGLVVFALWVGLDRWLAFTHLGSRVGYDPFASIADPGLRWLFLGARVYGLVLMVPVMEELFWRSFILRYLTHENFRQVPPAAFSLRAFWIMVAASAATHPEWVVAAIASAGFAWIVRRTGSLFAAIVCHAVANAALGAYILVTGAWKYW